MQKKESKTRSLLKGISWRIIATIDTILLSWFITDNIAFGLKIGLIEVATKISLYFFHERIWNKISLNSDIRKGVFKTFSWRVIGTIDTIIISWFVTGNIGLGLKIGLVEVITKMILYYFHDRAWSKVSYGLQK